MRVRSALSLKRTRACFDSIACFKKRNHQPPPSLLRIFKRHLDQCSRMSAYVLHSSPVFTIGDALFGFRLKMRTISSSVCTKVSRAIWFLKYCRKILPQNTLSKMYRRIVEPHFRFCCSVWGCFGVTKLQTLQKLQNRTV